MQKPTEKPLNVTIKFVTIFVRKHGSCSQARNKKQLGVILYNSPEDYEVRHLFAYIDLCIQMF